MAEGIAARALPSPNPDNANVQISTNRRSMYGETYVSPVGNFRHMLADEATYFRAGNPTPGTGIQLSANVTAFSDTNGLFVIQNTVAAGTANGKRIYMDYLRLNLLATAPTATVSMEFAFKKSAISREPTTAANRTVLTAASMREGAGLASIGTYMSYANAGAMTVPASVAANKFVGRCTIPTGLGIAGDEYIVQFGADALSVWQGGAAVRATDVARRGTVAPPIVIDPGEWLVIHMWWLTAATTAATFEFELGMWER